MRAVASLLAVLMLPALAAAQPAPATAPAPVAPSPGTGAGAQPPQYTPVRWNENYLYLRDPARRTDPFDSIKYVPLNEEGDWYLSLGGQARYRYEWFNNANFGAGPQDDSGFHLLRLLGHVDLHLGANVRAFVQVNSALADGRTGGARPNIDENDFDFHQAFVDLKIPLSVWGGAGGSGETTLLLRGGRQNLIYGAQRLISPLDWTNTRRTFDGGKLSLNWPANNVIDVFVVRPVIFDKGPLDSSDDNQLFAGVYDTITLPEVIEGAGTKLDLYALYLRRDVAIFGPTVTDETRFTLGSRFYTNPKPWDFDVEAAYQFGRWGADDDTISAWMFATEAGYVVQNCPTTPRLFIGLDVASGDSDPTDSRLGTFNQLFPLGHAYLGYVDVVGRQNVIDLHPGVELTLLGEKRHVKKLTLRADYHLFWRYSDDDALYGPASQVIRQDGGSDARFIGSEIDLLLNWQVDRHLNAYFGYSHFFTGDFLEQTGPSGDISFFYAAVQFTF